MPTVIGCFIGEHDPWLVALAALICSQASIACLALARHARRSQGRARTGWLVVAAGAGGSGVWATHFIAMLAFEPSLPTGYTLGLTALSLIYAVMLTGLALAVALSTRVPLAPALGGLILGGGIAAMHYTGMAAFEVPGHLRWNPVLVGLSLVCGVALGSAGLKTGLSLQGLRSRILGALLIMAAICSHHFTAMSAITIVPDPSVVLNDGVVGGRWLAGAVAVASFGILLLAAASLVFDIRDRRHAALAQERLNSLANAAFEGLLVCQDLVIVNANDSFGSLVGLNATEVTGLLLTQFLPGAEYPLAQAGQPHQLTETQLHRPDGETVPVELIVRPFTDGGKDHLAVAIRDLRARKSAERQIHFLAHHDPLTGLANRTTFHERLDREMALAAANGRKLAVLCLDLDRFKEVNDLFGHAAGDELLIDVGRKASALLDESQLMARLGGDEFAILMPCDRPDEAATLAASLLKALRSGPLGGPLDKAAPMLGTSVGIALYPDHANERMLLLGHADTALYHAKADGRGTYRVFNSTMGVKARDRRSLENDLRQAVAEGRLELVYQPQMQILIGVVTGFEVLLRWPHPVRGMVSPEVFIPIAEESGLILTIGEWVLREACREAARWSRPLAVSVNVSGRQIVVPRFVPLVADILRETGLEPSRLELELTETALVRDPTRTQSIMAQLKAMGVRIAMDDFGTGYSLIPNLRTFPFDTIKIDGSFIRMVDSNAQSAAIVRSMIGLGRGLGMTVIAEGVETAAELNFLIREDCAAVQGYLTGLPSKIAAFAHLTEPAQDAAGQGDRAA